MFYYSTYFQAIVRTLQKITSPTHTFCCILHEYISYIFTSVVIETMFKILESNQNDTESVRLGEFMNTIPTPAPILRTFIGNPLYTTPDAINEVKENYLGQLDVADLVYKDFKDIPLAKLYKNFENVQKIMSGRQSGKKYDSNCDAGGMNIETNCGRKQLNVARYVERVVIDKPSVVVALADEV